MPPVPIRQLVSSRRLKCASFRGANDCVSLCLLVALAAAYAGAAAFACYSVAAAVRKGTFSGNATLQDTAAGIAAVFVTFCLPIALFDIAHHIARYTHPLQRHYVRILMMAPVYSIESYLALAVPEQHQYIEAAREAYESIMLLSLFSMVCESLGTKADVVAVLEGGVDAYAAAEAAAEAAEAEGVEREGGAEGEDALGGGSPGGVELVARGSDEASSLLPRAPPPRGGGGSSSGEAVLLALLDGSFLSCSCRRSPLKTMRGAPAGRVKLLTPCCCLGYWRLDASFLSRCKFGVAQYIVMRIVCSAVTLVTKDQGTFGDGNWDALHPSLWISLAINFSQLWALWSLIFFATTLWPALRPLRPLPKFLLVKVVVFGFWWQSVTLDWFAAEGWLNALEAPSDAASPDSIADAADTALVLQNVLIAVEITVVAILHHYAFGLHDFQRPSLQSALRRHARGKRAAGVGGALGSGTLESSSSPASLDGAHPDRASPGAWASLGGVGGGAGDNSSGTDARSPSRMLAKAANVFLAAAGGARGRKATLLEEEEGGVEGSSNGGSSEEESDGGSGHHHARAAAFEGNGKLRSGSPTAHSPMRKSDSVGAFPASDSPGQDHADSSRRFGRGSGALAALTDLLVPLDTVADSVGVVTDAGSAAAGALWRGAAAIAHAAGGGSRGAAPADALASAEQANAAPWSTAAARLVRGRRAPSEGSPLLG